MTRLCYSAAVLACLSLVSGAFQPRPFSLLRPLSRQDEPFQMRQNVLPAEDVIPPEDPNLVVVRPAGGDVVPFGGGIHNLLVAQGVAEPAMAVNNDNRQAISPFGTNTGTATGTATGTGTGAAAATPAAVATPASVATPAAVVVTQPSSGGVSVTPATSSSAASTVSAVTAATVTGNSVATVSAATGPAVTGATGAIITTAAYGVTAAPAVTTTTARPVTTAPAYGSSPSSYGSSPSSYGSSSYGSSSGSGSSSSSSQNVNSIGVPYGEYYMAPYFPYAPSASSQITSPLIFSPNLPIPSYINKYFGLDFPLTAGRR